MFFQMSFLRQSYTPLEHLRLSLLLPSMVYLQHLLVGSGLLQPGRSQARRTSPAVEFTCVKETHEVRKGESTDGVT